MKPGQTEHIGDGAYLHFDGHGFELRANHHEHPTDRVYIDGSCVLTLQRLIRETIETAQGERCQECNKRLSDEERGQRICELCSSCVPCSQDDPVQSA